MAARAQSFMTTVAEESAAMPETQSQARAAGALNDLPLVVAVRKSLPTGVATTYRSISREWLLTVFDE
jgi:hypothetical protein